MTNETKAMATIPEMKEIAKIVHNSKLFSMPSPEATFTLMMLCQSEGLNPIQAVKRYHIIHGRPSMRADAMLAEFQRQGGKIIWNERTDKKCSATFSHPAGGELEVSWTIEMAQKARLTNSSTWQSYPRQMLTARVISEGVRTVLPGVVSGIYTPEEVQDFSSKPVVTKKAKTIDDVVVVTEVVPEPEVIGKPEVVPEPEVIPETKVISGPENTTKRIRKYWWNCTKCPKNAETVEKIPPICCGTSMVRVDTKKTMLERSEQIKAELVNQESEPKTEPKTANEPEPKTETKPEPKPKTEPEPKTALSVSEARRTIIMSRAKYKIQTDPFKDLLIECGCTKDGNPIMSASDWSEEQTFKLLETIQKKYEASNE